MSERRTILVVDDSPTQVQGLRHMLEERGFETGSAASGEEALEVLRRGSFDLVLSDVVMPGMSGYDLCREIKDSGEFQPTPAVVLLTSLADPVDIVRGLESHADNYVTKPYDPDRLVERLDEVLANHELRDEHTGARKKPVTLQFLGRSFEISADRQQILQLLLSSYDELVQTNAALAESRAELNRAHQRELAVEQRIREEVERSAERLGLLARASSRFSKADDSRQVAETLTSVVKGSASWSVAVLFSDRDDDVCSVESVSPREGEDVLAPTGEAAVREGETLVPRHEVAVRGGEAMVRDGDATSRDGVPTPLGPDACVLLRSFSEQPGTRHLTEDDRVRLASALAEVDAVKIDTRRPAMAVPLRWRRRAVGLLILGQNEERAFDPADTPVLENICGRAAVAIDGHRLLAQEKQARSEAEDAIKLRDDVMATVSHDLRNTVGVTYSAASLLLEIPLPEEATTAQLKLIRRAADQANRMIEDLFMVATQESGTFTVVPKPVQVSELLDEADTLMSPVAEDAGVSLVVEEPGEDATLDADPDRIFRVFSNLIGNAIKYSPKGAEVTLSTTFRADSVEFFVTDRGPGIAEEALPRIFDRFYQVESEQGAGGAGLGLAIAQSIVTAHGGTIAVESVRNDGTTFRFTLPRPDARQQ